MIQLINRYIGDIRNDKFTGKGSLIFSDGRKYEGQFLNN